ncbi:ABC transporter permease [Alkalihalobacillus oceani]|uniref:ABC transporter permease n=1 Tax=Halalkalibacter oceani TaxID=1653776 RepID=UPI00203E3894|nr:ABC transporter permease [Halalkalibacter oceani]MCM3762972.1 ABC transporter permease [Halalkalibacter oceani]
MTFRKFAFNNVLRNKRLYAAYFLSSMFTVMVFFTFSIFAYHPALSGSDMNANVQQGMNISAGIIYVFSFFFILYSMSSFLQSRKKEFGLLMLQGMAVRQIRMMVFLENMLIGFFATIGGVGLGLVFAKAILLVAENLLVIGDELPFYLPTQAVVVTFVSFIVLFFVISLFVSYVLRTKKLIELIKGAKKSKGEPAANRFLVICAVILLGAGYGVALSVEGVGVLAAMLPVIIVVTIGTYLLFTQLSVFIIRRLKRNEAMFWHKTNMLLFSDLSFRMKDNARTFFMVAMVSTVAFSAMGTLYSFQSVSSSYVEMRYPNTFAYLESDERDVEEDIALVENMLAEEKVETDKAQMVLSYYEVAGDRILIARQSDFNRFAELIGEEELELENGQMIAVEFEGMAYGQTEELLGQTVPLASGVDVTAADTIESRALPEVDSYFVVTDHDFSELLLAPVEERGYHAWQAADGEQRILNVAERVYVKLPLSSISSRDYEVDQTKKGYAPIMFVGLFIGLVFFVAAGSFLYFRLYMDLDEDKEKFRAIAKMGLSVKELKKVLSRQTALLFFAPIVVALIHGAVALTALSHLFYENLVRESAIVLGTFLIIQIIYFFIVRFFYTKQIQVEIT